MGQPVTFAAVAGLALAGTGLGLYLGESAVAEIDPAHYGSYGGSRFFADLVPNPPDRDSPPAPAYANAPLPTDYGTGCIGCSRASVEYLSFDAEPAFADIAYIDPDAYAPHSPEEIVAEVEADLAAAATARERRERVLRYAHFQVAAGEEAETAEPKPVRAAQSVSRTAGDCLGEDRCAGTQAPGI